MIATIPAAAFFFIIIVGAIIGVIVGACLYIATNDFTDEIMSNCPCGTDDGPPCPCRHGLPLCNPCSGCKRT